ncbi:hypothetical protein CMV_014532 [Castanea mollissima]|uniref:BZIP domain-containing protein n=1 Tax=Castanea mollissima TaxID=60419 RepID=A0A8J4VGZ0_9ROSI|nr:hypothetical protein CMV_014532 [Castanea mollissima]
MMARDEWMRAAMTDDMVVVQLLVRLKQSQAASSSSSLLKSPPRAVVPLRWGIRQPRSRSATLRCDGAVSRRKDADSTRCSPTTPLSWSGGASPSATADDSTSFHTSLSYAATARSKGTATNESTATKRTRRKKTFAELKEEESSLLNERIQLNKELEKLRATFKEQNARNESFKKMKLDLGLHSAMNLSASQRVDSSTLTVQDTNDNRPQLDSCEADKAASAGCSNLMLPDLNMVPTEEDSGSETLYGMS